MPSKECEKGLNSPCMPDLDEACRKCVADYADKLPKERAPAGRTELNCSVPGELVDLVRFLCLCWQDTDNKRYEAMALPENEIKGFLCFKWTMIQGTSNQINLMNIGKQSFNQENVVKAVKWMLES